MTYSGWEESHQQQGCYECFLLLIEKTEWRPEPLSWWRLFTVEEAVGYMKQLLCILSTIVDKAGWTFSSLNKRVDHGSLSAIQFPINLPFSIWPPFPFQASALPLLNRDLSFVPWTVLPILHVSYFRWGMHVKKCNEFRVLASNSNNDIIWYWMHDAAFRNIVGEGDPVNCCDVARRNSSFITLRLLDAEKTAQCRMIRQSWDYSDFWVQTCFCVLRYEDI